MSTGVSTEEETSIRLTRDEIRKLGATAAAEAAAAQVCVRPVEFSPGGGTLRRRRVVEACRDTFACALRCSSHMMSVRCAQRKGTNCTSLWYHDLRATRSTPSTRHGQQCACR